MQRALTIQEIVRHICAFLRADRPSLAALVKTCRSTHDPAVQELWKVLDDLLPLLKCFPADSWTIGSGLDSEVTFTRALQPQDWQRFLYYSQHVHVIGLGRESCHEGYEPWRISPASLAAMVASRPVKIVLPRVRSFEWNCLSFGNENLNTVFSLMGLQVRALDLGLWGSDLDSEESERRPQAALAEIAGRFPMLESFKVGIDGYEMPYSVGGRVLSHDGAFEPHNLPNLTVVRFHSVPIVDKMVCALARLPNLQIFEADLSPHSTWSEKLASDAFPALYQLILTTTARTYIAFSAAITLDNVESAHLQITDTPEQSDIPTLFQSVRQQFSPSSLRVLNIFPGADFYSEEPVEPLGSVVRPGHLESLYSFSKLVDLTVAVACRYAFDDACYLTIAKSYPRLRALSLADCHPCVYDTFPSMTALAPFAQHSTLESLSVSFDGTQQVSLTDIRNALPPRDRPSGVKTLHVGLSPVEQPQIVAAYLARLFPEVGTSLDADDMTYGWRTDPQDTERRERWHLVKQLLPCFKLIREDERDMTTRRIGRRDERRERVRHESL